MIKSLSQKSHPTNPQPSSTFSISTSQQPVHFVAILSLFNEQYYLLRFFPIL